MFTISSKLAADGSFVAALDLASPSDRALLAHPSVDPLTFIDYKLSIVYDVISLRIIIYLRVYYLKTQRRRVGSLLLIRAPAVSFFRYNPRNDETIGIEYCFIYIVFVRQEFAFFLNYRGCQRPLCCAQARTRSLSELALSFSVLKYHTIQLPLKACSSNLISPCLGERLG